jgi:hypothetical protein
MEKRESNPTLAVTQAAKFGQLYALLSMIRETSRQAEQLAGSILQQKDLERVERIGGDTNAAIGLVLDAQRRMLHETGMSGLS